jgi:NADPH:quinone reductase-like Zn-dependent oxidoreductase
MERSSRLAVAAGWMALVVLQGAAFSQTPDRGVPARMKAIVHHGYGSPDVLRLEELDTPVPDDGQVLIRVRAAAVNPLDWHYMRGTPYVMRLGTGMFAPEVEQLGVDFSGTVEAVGKDVTKFRPGDEVFGGRTGAFAEFVCVGQDRAVVRKSANLTFEQAASVPIAALTALQSLRDAARVQPGQTVLINGASGGVGTFAVQIAKSYGAEVTGVCSTRNLELVRSLGADHVIDYTQEDFTEGAQRYDVLLDCVGNHSLLACRRVLKPEGKYVMIGGPSGRWLRPMDSALEAMVLSQLVSQDMGMFLADMNQEDLAVLSELMASGKVTPVIDRTYQFSELPEAIRYLEEGHARGKVVVTLGPNGDPAPLSPPFSPSFAERLVPYLLVLAFLAVVVGAPILAALALNRRWQRAHPGKRPFRWGYYFSVQAFVGGLCLATVLEGGLATWVVCIVVYGALAWFFAQRRRWAWVALTIVTFNPIAWIINSIYLGRRWREDSAAAPGR